MLPLGDATTTDHDASHSPVMRPQKTSVSEEATPTLTKAWAGCSDIDLQKTFLPTNPGSAQPKHIKLIGRLDLTSQKPGRLTTFEAEKTSHSQNRCHLESTAPQNWQTVEPVEEKSAPFNALFIRPCSQIGRAATKSRVRARSHVLPTLRMKIDATQQQLDTVARTKKAVTATLGN